MPLFEVSDGRARLVSPMLPQPASFGSDVRALLADHLAAVLGGDVFVVRRTDGRGAPALTALDTAGRVVAVDVVHLLDHDALVGVLRRAGAVSRLTSVDLARAYHADTSRLARDLETFRAGRPVPPAPGSVRTPRVVVICADVAADVADAVEFWSADGRHAVLQLGVVRGEDGRRLLALAPWDAGQSRRGAEPAELRLVAPRPVAGPVGEERQPLPQAATARLDHLAEALARMDGHAPVAPAPVVVPGAALSTRSTSQVAAEPIAGAGRAGAAPGAPARVTSPAALDPPVAELGDVWESPLFAAVAATRPLPGGLRPTPPRLATASPGVERPTTPRPPATGSGCPAPPSGPASFAVPPAVAATGPSTVAPTRSAPTPARATRVVAPAAPTTAQAAPTPARPTSTPPPAARPVPSAPGHSSGQAADRLAAPPSAVRPPSHSAAYPELVALADAWGAPVTLSWVRLRRGQRHVGWLREDGLITLPSGFTYDDPSAAAEAAAQLEVEVDGWRAWRLGDGGPTLAEAVAALHRPRPV